MNDKSEEKKVKVSAFVLVLAHLLFARLKLALLRAACVTVRAIRNNREALLAVTIVHLLYLRLRHALMGIAGFVSWLFAQVKLLLTRIAYRVLMAVYRLCGGDA